MKILKWLGIVLLLLIGGLAVLMYIKHEPLPSHTPSSEGDMLADKMLTALNEEAWDSLSGLTWEFPGGHKYIWNKKKNTANISWDNLSVDMNLNSQTGSATERGIKLVGDELQSALNDAWSIWCNDSFWMFAPYKVKDPNTTRSVVKNDGKDALMVSFGGGGVTPGDSYLWILDENYIPKAYKMWVDIIPIGGLEFSWEEWETLSTGAKLSTKHVSDFMTIDMQGVAEVH